MFESHCVLDDTYKAFHKKSIIQVKYGIGNDGLCPPSVHILKLKQGNDWNQTSKSTSECVKKYTYE